MKIPRRPSVDGSRPALRPVLGQRPPERVAAAVLLLHGGQAEALQAPPLLNLPALRMQPFAGAIARATAPAEVLVARVRYRHRGWNGAEAHPVADTVRALGELRDLVGPVPVVLVGHSMGARAALRAAGEPEVKGVVALAPWCPPGEPVDHLRGRTVVALHDESDRITAAPETWSLLGRAEAAGAQVLSIRMSPGGHTMLRGAPLWHRTAAEATAALLGLGPLPTGPLKAPRRTGGGSLRIACRDAS
ncbi:alpha/beta fold hydrolase [Streptomyces sp. NPDC053431]|uniref:alpha/beta fold hydrolase n=1 Tax=Streptomyces sp. NPDC053431 TaxID=3365703 RepID=UPI0037D15661